MNKYYSALVGISTIRTAAKDLEFCFEIRAFRGGAWVSEAAWEHGSVMARNPHGWCWVVASVGKGEHLARCISAFGHHSVECKCLRKDKETPKFPVWTSLHHSRVSSVSTRFSWQREKRVTVNLSLSLSSSISLLIIDFHFQWVLESVIQEHKVFVFEFT